MTNEYTAQADAFLAKHGLTFSAQYAGNRKHFLNDDAYRDVYNCTVIRTSNGSSFSVSFGQSIVGTKNKDVPTTYDVLACLTKYHPGNLKEFSADFGYSLEHAEAQDTRAIYSRVSSEWVKIRDFFTLAELDELREIN